MKNKKTIGFAILCVAFAVFFVFYQRSKNAEKELMREYWGYIYTAEQAMSEKAKDLDISAKLIDAVLNDAQKKNFDYNTSKYVFENNEALEPKEALDNLFDTAFFVKRIRTLQEALMDLDSAQASLKGIAVEDLPDDLQHFHSLYLQLVDVYHKYLGIVVEANFNFDDYSNQYEELSSQKEALLQQVEREIKTFNPNMK